jgi:hypothetical protein
MLSGGVMSVALSVPQKMHGGKIGFTRRHPERRESR